MRRMTVSPGTGRDLHQINFPIGTNTPFDVEKAGFKMKKVTKSLKF